MKFYTKDAVMFLIKNKFNIFEERFKFKDLVRGMNEEGEIFEIGDRDFIGNIAYQNLKECPHYYDLLEKINQHINEKNF